MRWERAEVADAQVPIEVGRLPSRSAWSAPVETFVGGGVDKDGVVVGWRTALLSSAGVELLAECVPGGYP